MYSTDKNAQSKRSYVLLYTPPHLRTGNADTRSRTNHKTVKHMNNNSKGSSGIEEQFSKLNITPRRKHYDFGLSTYYDYRFKGSQAEYQKKLEKSTTLYVGNLNLSTTELEIRTLFSKAGNIKSIKMGIDKKTSGFGGFCFIEYETRAEAEKCKNKKDIFLKGNKVFVDWDAGYSEGREYTRRKIQRSASVYPSNQKVNARVNHVMKQDNQRLA